MNTADKEFKVVTEFSETPGPRFRDEGDFSGEELREDHLLPLVRDTIENDQTLLVDLDGTHGYLTSFLEEAFGGLIRVDKIQFEILSKVLSFKSDEEKYLIDDIDGYMQDAQDETF